MGICGDGGIVVGVIVTAVASVLVLFISNILNCMFCGRIWGVGSDSGVNSGCGGSSLAHHSHPYQYNKHHHHQHHNQLHHHLYNTAYT